MKQLFFVVCFGISIVWTTGCDSGPKKAPTADVKGKVNLDGKPMPSGEISFASGSEPVLTFPIKEGEFSGQAYVGKNKVEIALMKDAPPPTTNPPPKVNVIPARFNTQTTLKAEIPASGASDLKFDVESK